VVVLKATVVGQAAAMVGPQDSEAEGLTSLEEKKRERETAVVGGGVDSDSGA
jgi:hypothetical protein